MTAATLRKFDVVIWNNISGDALSMRQRKAFRDYVERGGGFVGIHGSGGDAFYDWQWYADTLIGAQFIGHSMNPQFQTARLIVDDPASPIMRGLGAGFTMNDEWYSFAASPRASGAHVLLSLDESSYAPKGAGRDLSMKGDHPIAWTRCVGNGRSFYSAIGHLPETYREQVHIQLLEQAIQWAAGRGETACRAGREVTVALPRAK